MKILLTILVIIVISNLHAFAQVENVSLNSIQMQQTVSADLILNLNNALDLISTDKKQAITILKSSLPELSQVKEVNGKRTIKFSDTAKRVIQLIKAKKIIKAEITLNQLITALSLINN